MYNQFRHPHRSIQDAHPNWRAYTFVQVLVIDLPPNVTTLDVHRNLRTQGNISSITLFETREGKTSHQAEVVFKPPPDIELWKPGTKLKFEKDRKQTYVRFQLSRYQRKNFTVKSPLRNGVVYDHETIIHATSLDLGVLQSKRRMLVMKSVPSDAHHDVRMILNLRNKEIEIHFPSLLNSGKGPQVRQYRFRVALDDMFLIWKIENKEGRSAYIIHVKNAPWYSRRLIQAVAMSHSSEARRWTEDDQWTRQTDIVDDKETFTQIDKTAVGLEKNLNCINIGRWTTFKININTTPANLDRQRIFESALQDFNLGLIEPERFEICTASPKHDASFWKLVGAEGQTMKNTEMLTTVPWHLDFPIRYQLEVCISQGCLSEYDIDKAFLSKLANMPEHKALQMLLHVDATGERIFDAMSVFDDTRFLKPVKARQLPPNCVELYHAVVTATTLKLYSPTVEVSNRIIRKYKHYAGRFLRVRFEDDEYRGQTKLYAATNNKMMLIFARIKRALQNGLQVAGRHYDFLAWGNSQLREHGCYFFASAKDLSASDIRAEMGAFDDEKVVAKRAARMGQCFSTTQPIHLRLPPITKASTIPDIIRGKYNFTDGVGKISPLAAGMVCASLKIVGQVPSCFQFRLGGCKGVLALDPTLPGINVQVRASQFKFDSPSQELEIIRWSEFWQPFLNRQIIIVLSELGVPDATFVNMEKRAMQALNDALTNDNAALKALRDNVDPNRMSLVIAELVSSGFRRSQEPFVISVLYLWRAWSLKYLKEKAKIPVRKGAFVLGVVDETATLRGHYDDLQLSSNSSQQEREKTLPEIFVQATNPQTGRREVVEGICVLARNPSLHPGDIRVVKAVDLPSLHHLCDVVVLPQTGDRDLASMCSGGDLDGDDYMVIWDPDLIPKIWNAEPFHYDAPTPKTAEEVITIDQIIDFFIDYLQNDLLGRIAHAHLGAADFFTNGLQSDTCLELVQLHSMAVDYPKTGVPALLPRRLERNIWPHFMEKKSKPYISRKVLGQLYNAVKRIDFRPRYDLPFDVRILNAMVPSSKVRLEIEGIKREYDEALQRIMAQHKIKTEFEVWSTFVMDHSKASRDFKFHEEIGQLSKALKDQYHQAVVDVAGGSTYEQLAPFVVAAYQLTHQQIQDVSYASSHIEVEEEEDGEGEELRKAFISFPWLFGDILGRVASMAESSTSYCGPEMFEASGTVIFDDVVLDNGLRDGEYYERNELNDDGTTVDYRSAERNKQHDAVETLLKAAVSELGGNHILDRLSALDITDDGARNANGKHPAAVNGAVGRANEAQSKRGESKSMEIIDEMTTLRQEGQEHLLKALDPHETRETRNEASGLNECTQRIPEANKGASETDPNKANACNDQTTPHLHITNKSSICEVQSSRNDCHVAETDDIYEGGRSTTLPASKAAVRSDRGNDIDEHIKRSMQQIATGAISTSQDDGSLNPTGHMKDPALMTEEESAAFFGNDDDL